SHVRRERRADPRCFPGFALYAMEDGRLLAQVIPLRLRVRLTTGIETIGGVAGVCSHPSQWGRGSAWKTMEGAHDLFRAEGYRIAALTTSRNIRGFGLYQKMGYVEPGSFYRAYRDLPRHRTRPTGVRLPAATRVDIPAIVRLFQAHTRGLHGWTVRGVEDLRSRVTWSPRFLEKFRMVVRGATPVGYFRTRPADDVLMEEVMAPNDRDFAAVVAVQEARARTRIATVNWIAATKDQDRFRSLGYEIDGPIPDVTMARSLDDRLDSKDLPTAFGVTGGTFAHYPTEDF
ncbi:MAG: GNAT family N-acetyltransferase, partial [Thermoplasmata archaeon]|nr:GNAT family N-acetyltransferase [Thermoplasmata archaeon]